MATNCKYREKILLIPQCPPVSATHQEIEAWRWTANPVNEKCFYPEALGNPQRFLDSSDETKCSAWAVSMFISEDAAKKRMDEICQNSPKFRKKKGGHVSKGTITAGDGLVTNPDRRGHFNFHPYNSFDWQLSFVLVGSL